MRFDRLILIAGWLATAGAAATAWSATRSDLSGDGLGTHLLLALVSAMGMLLPHLWTAIYLVRLRRVRVDGVGRLARRRELTRCLPVLGVAVVVIGTAMVSGASAYSSGGRGFHRELAWAALVVQPLALWWVGQALGAHARRLAAAPGSQGAAPPSGVSS